MDFTVLTHFKELTGNKIESVVNGELTTIDEIQHRVTEYKTDTLDKAKAIATRLHEHGSVFIQVLHKGEEVHKKGTNPNETK